MLNGLGPGVGVTTDEMPVAHRQNTRSAMDFAYWSTINAIPYPVHGVIVLGSTTRLDGSELLTWCAGQVGLPIPFTPSVAAYRAWCTDIMPVSTALAIRGSVLFSDTGIAICLGFSTVVEAHGDHHYIRRLHGIEQSAWSHGALIPGVVY